jgi:hypothetical protein
VDGLRVDGGITVIFWKNSHCEGVGNYSRDGKISSQ